MIAASIPSARPMTDVAFPFRWRDRAGDLHDPKKMETRHLYFTVAMIWNHAMPPQARTHEFRRYRFPAFYTTAYMRDAVRHLMPELMRRGDLAPEWAAGLAHMRRYLDRDGQFDETAFLPKGGHA